MDAPGLIRASRHDANFHVLDAKSAQQDLSQHCGCCRWASTGQAPGRQGVVSTSTTDAKGQKCTAENPHLHCADGVVDDGPFASGDVKGNVHSCERREDV